ncbi:lipopolysaccharide biosynthesis protein [Chitinophaga lutea]
MASRKTHFLIYTITSLLQKGVSFLLLPVYTKFLTQEDYGTVSISTTSVALLSVVFTFGLDTAIVRLYFDFRQDPSSIREKLGSLLVAMQVLGLGIGSVLLVVGLLFFRDGFFGIPFLPFYPMILLILFFQPTFSLVQALFQAMEKSRLFLVFNGLFFVVNLSLTLYSVIVLQMGAFGVIGAQLVSLFVFFFFGLWTIRRLWKPAMNLKIVTESLRYAAPMIPHSLGGQLAATADRYILSYYFDVRQTGLLHLGYQASQPMELLSGSFNRAFIPFFHHKLSENSVSSIREIGLFAVLAFSTIALGGSLFVGDVFTWFINAKFHGAIMIIPLLIFSHVATTLYYFFSAILFYDKQRTRLIPICTVSSAIIGIGLNFVFVRHWGLWGAAVSQLASQVVLFLMAFLLSYRFSAVKWNYGLMIAIFVLYAGVGVVVSTFAPTVLSSSAYLAVRLVLCFVSVGICAGYYFLYITNTLPKSIFKRS